MDNECEVCEAFIQELRDLEPDPAPPLIAATKSAKRDRERPRRWVYPRLPDGYAAEIRRVKGVYRVRLTVGAETEVVRARSLGQAEAIVEDWGGDLYARGDGGWAGRLREIVTRQEEHVAQVVRGLRAGIEALHAATTSEGNPWSHALWQGIGDLEKRLRALGHE